MLIERLCLNRQVEQQLRKNIPGWPSISTSTCKHILTHTGTSHLFALPSQHFKQCLKQSRCSINMTEEESNTQSKVGRWSERKTGFWWHLNLSMVLLWSWESANTSFCKTEYCSSELNRLVLWTEKNLKETGTNKQDKRTLAVSELPCLWCRDEHLGSSCCFFCARIKTRRESIFTVLIQIGLLGRHGCCLTKSDEWLISAWWCAAWTSLLILFDLASVQDFSSKWCLSSTLCAILVRGRAAW